MTDNDELGGELVEWLDRQEGRVVDIEQIPGLSEARGLTVGPDEVLVVVFPRWAGNDVLQAHTARLRDVLGNRFIMVMGDDIQLAKVRKDQWAVGTHDQ